MGHCLSSIFDNLRKDEGQAPFVTFTPRPYNCYNNAHAQGQHVWHNICSENHLTFEIRKCAPKSNNNSAEIIFLCSTSSCALPHAKWASCFSESNKSSGCAGLRKLAWMWPQIWQGRWPDLVGIYLLWIGKVDRPCRRHTATSFGRSSAGANLFFQSSKHPGLSGLRLPSVQEKHRHFF